MGIKGLYKEIGAGARVSFLRLAVDSLEKRGRPLRLAIDISIWQFQVQSGRGGSNPAVRTLFYRLIRLLGMPVQPVFVFDGINKPLFKRHKRSTGPGDMVASSMAKRMIRMFGFYVHDAPGEAEAECALLQQRGVVDAVLSEDVDTLMFGSTRTLRNWSAATTNSSGKGSASATATHVTMYETEAAVATSIAPEAILKTKETGLDREGMILVALMSGGDYLPEGVPGCGVKLACEAAKAGYGRRLCRIKRSDAASLAEWRSDLQHELRTNESKFFRTCHHKLVIPADFPNLDILRYYTHPVVSPADVVERVRLDLDSTIKTAPSSVAVQGTDSIKPKPIDVLALRDFVAETFDWSNRGGAIKFIRVLAPVLLARMLLLKWPSANGGEEMSEDLDNDIWLPSLVEGISRQRIHASTDNTPEIRVSYIPVNVVGLDLDSELDDLEVNYGRDGLALNSDDDFDDLPPTALAPTMPGDTAGSLTVASVKKPTTGTPYDPTVPCVTWVPRTIVHIGAPATLAEWEKKQQRGKKSATEGTKPTTRKPKSKKSNMPAGALDRFVRVTKNTRDYMLTGSQVSSTEKAPPKVPPTFKANTEVLQSLDFSEDDVPDLDTQPGVEDYDLPEIPRKNINKTSSTAKIARSQYQKKGNNPWALSGSQNVPRVTKNNTSNQKREFIKPTSPPTVTKSTEVINLMTSSPFTTAAYEPIQIPTSPIPSSPPPAASFSSLAWSPSPLKKAAASQTQDTGASVTGKVKPRSKTNPKLPSQASPQKQASIRDFLSPSKPSPAKSPAKPSAAILLSDDDEGTSTLVKKPATTVNNEDPFLSSSPLPAVFMKRYGQAAQVAEQVSLGAERVLVKSNTKRTQYIPRTSATGFFREEIADDMSADSRSPSPVRSRRWRQSEISIVDLTEEGLK
ncbi:holliday junction resolvase YEN1 [Sporothrix schenckii 1099-18]|uniref:Holliday junction resolvase YEN1 n=1 Tax=Sporothrix schenckii 1099-18 TaxID=1397361 RepID=A0A0F2M9C9_SPOSC|nr:holliday junction resolvase YEN1 [Sporothrix schenckii 1099-18]KJR85425.1 holliday junction resolvase YEN1 [Sporothrix schenckii 1099-18]